MGGIGIGPGARQVRWMCLVVLVAALLAIVPAQRGIDQVRNAQARAGELLLIPDGTTMRRLCLGHEGLLANIYWTRVVQYFGRQRIDQSMSFDLLGPLLRITTDLDPHLIIAYRFGAIFLTEKPPRGAGRPQEALQLLRKGIVANPDYWRLWQDLGFIYYWDLKDYETAARVFKAGSERPGALIWMRVMAAAIAGEGGAISTARLLWTEIYREAENDQIRRSAEEHLAALRALEDLGQLDARLAEFQRREGTAAESWQDLISAGLLRGIPRDPSGVPYRIGRDARAELGPGSRIDLKLLQ